MTISTSNHIGRRRLIPPISQPIAWVRGSYLTLLSLTLLGLLMVSTIGLAGPYHWIFDLFSHFKVQLFVASLLILPFVLLTNKKWLTGLMGLILLLNGIFLLPYIPWRANVPPHSDSDSTIRLMSVNTLYNNRNMARVIDDITANDPDILLLSEMNRRNKRTLRPLFDKYPYQLAAENSELAVLSKFPFEEATYRYPAASRRGQTVTTFTVNGQSLNVVGIHPPAPMREYPTERRNDELAELSEWINQTDQPVIVAGDMNITNYSLVFKSFLWGSDLKDSRTGRGLHPTWGNPHYPNILIPIDHILYSDGIEVHYFTSGEANGSDHRAVISDFVVLSE